MYRFYLVIILSFSLVTITQAQDSKGSLLRLYGKMLKAEDSTSIIGSIGYEKLPYYDDLGLVPTKPDGSFEIFLVKGAQYNISVSKKSFNKFSKKIDISEDQEFNIYMELDVSYLRKLKNLIFIRGSAEIVSTSYPGLDELAVWLKENHSVIIQLEGHTDFEGNSASNMKLSKSRVMAVREYLNNKKISKKRLLTKAFGDTHPLAQGRTEELKALNRRVEVRIIRR